MSPELLTPDEVRRLDAAAALAGTPGFELMARAAAEVVDVANDMIGGAGGVVVACGPGNNGGDGLVAARLLSDAGRRVTVLLLGDRTRLTGDAALAAAQWSEDFARLDQVRWAHADLIIDALFGVGLSRDLDAEAVAVVEAINAAARPVLAVDLPSGIDGATGAVRGSAVRATRTVTFERRRPGHLLLPGRLFRGPVEVRPICLPEGLLAEIGVRTFANEPALWRASFPEPAAEGHKYHRGHAVVVSGPMSHTGAARLAARAALRVGAGLVTLASPAEALMVNATHLTAVMLRRCDGAEALAELLGDARFNAVALGPGLSVGPGTCAMVEAALGGRRAVVLDADALTSFAGRAADLGASIRRSGSAAVVTPHDGEFSRLFAGSRAVFGSRAKLERARTAADMLGAVVVLKGADTVIASPDGRAAINETGSPYLATAGSGDVLTGLVTGLMAQGMPAFEAAGAAVWLHGEAGRTLGPGLIAEDLPEILPRVLGPLLA